MSSPGDTLARSRRAFDPARRLGQSRAARAQRTVARRRRAGHPRPPGHAHRPLLAVPHEGARNRRRPRRSGHNARWDGLLALRRGLGDARRPADPRALASRGIGRVAHRESPGVAGGYIANGCIECDALIGRFQLEDLLHEHLHAGGTYAKLDIGVPVELPAVALARRLTANG